GVRPEVVEPVDQAAASRIDQRIRLLVGTINDIVKLRELVDKAKRGHVHLKTVHLFLSGTPEPITGLDGKTYQRKRQQKRQQKLAGP
ncbi:MAG TPA: hypothetical protein VGO16_14120, partial [Pseudonocardiaceae bacterium]|nr:hypothetical protein [Pseudonocardiaceae bacterium]